MQGNNRTGVWAKTLFIGAILLGLTAGASATNPPLNQSGDFGQVARAGFMYTVDGAFPNLVSNANGSDRNSYSWSGTWFQGKLWVGTNREPFNEDRAAAGGAQIWRYTPPVDTGAGGFWGLDGHWDRVYNSPKVSRIVVWLSGGGVSNDFPRDAGYRNMSVCNAGGTGTTSRLYVTATGLPPNILYWNGSTFNTTSTSGFPTTLANLSDPNTADTGFRGLACFKGRLFASPAGTYDDVDISHHPVLLMNPNPAGGAAWQTVLDVKNGGSGTPAGMADANNIGIFQVNVVGNYIWLSTVNRTTGFELWRGDGADCLEPWVGNGHCNIAWTKVIDNGAGRPPDNFGPPIDDAGATLGVFGNDLYVAPSESGFYEQTYAELLRVPNAGTGGAKWQLLAGWPRKNFATSGRPGLENLDCTGHVDNMPGPGQYPSEWDDGPSFFQNSGQHWLSDAELDTPGDEADNDCMPALGSGPGLGLEDPYRNPLLPGPNEYFWRMAEYDGSFYIGSLDTGGGFRRAYPGEESGFNIYRLNNAGGGAVTVTTIDKDGLGNPDAYGVRTLVPTDFGLALGSANGNVGGEQNAGTDVFIGTTVPAAQVSPTPPHVDAGGDQFLYDRASASDPTPDPDQVEFQLDGTGYNTFGGTGALTYEWFQGSLASLGGDCSSISDTAIASTAQATVKVPAQDATHDVISQTFTLRVSNPSGANCDEVTLTASHNLAPTVDPWYSGEHPMYPSVPASYPSSGNRSSSPAAVNLIDPEGDGESYNVTAYCNDPEAALTQCKFQSIDLPGVTLSNVVDTSTNASLCSSQVSCQISAQLNVPDWTTLPLAVNQFNGRPDYSSVRPDVQVLAQDDHGNQDSTSWESLAQPIVNNSGNDAPVCRNADVILPQGADHVTFNPATFSPPICVDPDGDPLTYGQRTAGPSGNRYPRHGTVTGGSQLTYTYTGGGTPAPGVLDYFAFRAEDTAGAQSDDVAAGDMMIRVIVAGDAANPNVAIGFPANGNTYSANGYKAGCGTSTTGDICGTASDDVAVDHVLVSVRQAGGMYWNCSSAFNQASEQWCTATGTTAWNLPLPTPADGNYVVRAKAVDSAAHESTVAQVGFTMDASVDTTPPTASVTFPSNGGAYYSGNFNSGCGASAADVCGTASDLDSGVSSVEVSIQRTTDNSWWNGGSFVSGGQIWLPATGTTSWSYNFSPAVSSYSVQARATDGSGNKGTSSAAAFSYYSSFWEWFRNR